MTAMTFGIGDVIDGKYELTALLGQGGIGVVYAARRIVEAELVALKLLLPSRNESPAAAARFLEEALAGMRLDSEHVARIHDVGTFQGTPFLVMEHLDGTTLATALRECGPLSVTVAVDLLLQACEAVHEAHSLGFVHRNLTPGNLFVTPMREGQAPLTRLKVLDFGLEKWSIADEGSLGRNGDGVSVARYASPEQLTAPWRPDPSSDVWSLSAIFYEMLAGKPPFASDADTLCAAYRKLSAVGVDVPSVIDAFFGDAFALDRATRLSTVGALAARLAPLGSDAARALLARIEARTASAPAPPPASPTSDGVTPDLRPAPPRAPTPEPPRHPPALLDTHRRPRRWVRGAAMATLCMGVIAGAVWAWFHHSRAVRRPRSLRERLDALNARCTAGEPNACESLAALYGEGGDELPVDVIRRIDYEEKACKAGSAYSCSVVKLEYKLMDAESGIAISNMLLERACDRGALDACQHLGWLMVMGVTGDDAKGRSLLEKACHGGVQGACATLAGRP